MRLDSNTGAERIRYYDGSALTGSDLQDDLAYEERMRGAHIRAMHDTWGVALGFNVYLNAARDNVLVGPGVAYDCRGREIVSARSMSIDLPPLPAEKGDWCFDLLIRHSDLERHPEGGFTRPKCTGPGIGLSEERPMWRWSLAGDRALHPKSKLPLAENVRRGEEIPIARFTISGKVFSEPDYSFRPHARSFVRPRIAGGQTEKASVPISGFFWVWSVNIDTSAGNFTRTPFYFANLQHHPLSKESGYYPLLNKTTNYFRLLEGPFLSISLPTTNSFTLGVIMCVDHAQIDAIGTIPLPEAGQSTMLPVSINWFGIEPSERCVPLVDLKSIYQLSGSRYGDALNKYANLSPLTNEIIIGQGDGYEQ